MGHAQARIVLVDPQVAFADVLTERVDREPDLTVVGSAGGAHDLIPLVHALGPELVLTEVYYNNDRGAFDVISELAKCHPATKFLFLSGFAPDVFISQALRLGVGYLLKTERVSRILSAVRKTIAGETVYSPAVLERLSFDPLLKRYELKAGSPLMALTVRQIEIIRHLAVGSSTKEMAESLNLSEKGIESHKYRIMHKLGVHDRVELARLAFREGLLIP